MGRVAVVVSVAVLALLGCTPEPGSRASGTPDAPHQQVEPTATPPQEAVRLAMVLSHGQVASVGQSITLTVVNASDEQFSFGAEGRVQRWNGTDWQSLGTFVASLTQWSDGAWSGGAVARPGEEGDVPGIDYHVMPGQAGEPEWLTLPELEPGWYRLVRPGLGGMEGDMPDRARWAEGRQQAVAVLEVIESTTSRTPTLHLPWESPYLAVTPAGVPPGLRAVDAVPQHDAPVLHERGAQETVGTLTRWDGNAWADQQDVPVDLTPAEPVANTRAVRISLPQDLTDGLWQVQIEGARTFTGYFWIHSRLG